MAEAVVRARFLERKGGSVTSRELLDVIGVAGPAPELPAWIEALNRENAR